MRFQSYIFEKHGLIRLFFCLSILVTGIFSCTDSREAPTLRIILPQSALLDAPGERGKEIRTLAQGDQLIELGEVSSFESKIRLGNQFLIAPWVKVQTHDGQIGWVFSGAVQPISPDKNWFLDKQMRCYFGDALTLRRNRWRTNQSNLTNENDFAIFYHEGLALRDTFMYHLAHRSEPNGAELRPDFLWLSEALPGFIFQRIADGTQPYLFTDYKFFHKLAIKTVGHQDDQLIETYLLAYPNDGIESIAPVWTKQIAVDQAVSQLGLGYHWQMLRAIDAGLQLPNGLFLDDFLRLKESVLEDLLGKAKRYWQPEEKILAELNKIITSKFKCLTNAEQVALELRLAMFQDPAANGLPINLRAG